MNRNALTYAQQAIATAGVAHQRTIDPDIKALADALLQLARAVQALAQKEQPVG
jgi:hypothetical protein